ncbi:14879_t:CDS:2, partial [Gigaspora margarita]
MAISRTEAKDLPCLFNFLAGDYPESELAICETPEKQRWQHADAPMVENKVKSLVKYLPKLSPLLEKVSDSVFYIPIKRTKKKVLYDNKINLSLPEHSCDFGIQVSLPNPEYESLITEYESLIKKIDELEQLFGLTPEMQALLDRQLHDYLLSIITELCTEKNKEINVIDDLITNQ